MPFEPIVINNRSMSYISLDKFGRLRINKLAMKALKLEPHQYIVASVDVDLKRIGIAKQELSRVPNASIAKLDRRGQVSGIGKRIAEKLSLNLSQAPFFFVDIGWVDDAGVRWRAFELTEANDIR